MLEEFINDINKAKRNKDNVNILLSSYGGQVTLMPVLKEIMQDEKVTLTAYGEVSSSALDLFLTTNVERYILDETFCVLHKTKIDNITVDLNYKVNISKYLKPIWSKEVEARGKVIQCLDLSSTQLKDYNNDKDIFFSTEEFREALSKSEKLFTNTLVDKLN